MDQFEKLDAAMSEAAEAVERELKRFLDVRSGVEAPLLEAMRYAVFSGGKRLRPFLVISSAKLFSVPSKQAVRVAAAIECIHCYSLVHDDLPSMDNDDIRRGQPTVHKKFNEATAILVGDALQALAFEILADEKTHGNPAVRVELIAQLARASGFAGMVGGQMIDLEAANHEMDTIGITRLQDMKTGALIKFSSVAGAILAGTTDKVRQQLLAYGRDIGLAFQIVDDLLDYRGDAATVGKAVKKDQESGKATFVSALGAEKAEQQANILADQAIEYVRDFGSKADNLRALAKFVVNRKN